MPANSIRPGLIRFGADLLVRATSGICDRSRLNAELAGAVIEARRFEWSAVQHLYDDGHQDRPLPLRRSS
jgi:hypothetical protein